MLIEIVSIGICFYFIMTLWYYRRGNPDAFSEAAITKTMGTLLWLAIGLTLIVMIGLTILRIL